MEIEKRIRELIEAFDVYDGRYKRQEVEDAVSLQEEITPYLIGILEDIAADPEKYSLNDHYANMYAVALLAHFQEPAAHKPIIAAFLIDEEDLDDLWGDMVTETLPALLFQTCSGSLDEIKKLVLNQDAHQYVRGAGIDALTYAVARGVAERREIVDFLAALFTGDEAAEDSTFWSNIAASLADLHPEGAMDAIRDAFARGLMYPDYVGLEEIEADSRRPEEELLSRLSQKTDHHIPQDIHGYLSWFACFHENHAAPQPSPRFEHNALRRKKQKAAKKKKKKMAKKSRKKNRKK